MGGNKKKVWGVRCEVPSCRQSKKDFPHLRFFKFPSSGTAMFENWMTAIGLTIPPKPKNAYVCSKHFHGSSFGRKKLKNKSVPCLYLNNNSSGVDDLTPSGQDLNDLVYDSDSREHIPVLFSGKCYKGLDHDKLLLKDLTKYEPISNNKESQNIDFVCSSCLHSQKESKYYRSKYYSLKKKYDILRVKLQNKSKLYKSKNFAYHKKCLEIKKLKDHQNQRKSLVNEINLDKSINSNTKTLVEILCKNSKTQAWNEESRILAQNLHYKSPSAYYYMRNVLNINLPSISSIYRWMPVKNSSPGFNSSLKESLKIEISKLNDEDKLAVLIFDEMAIRRDITYDSVKDEIIGYADLGDLKTKDIAKNICLFMVRGIFTNFKSIISYYPVKNSITGEQLEIKIKENIQFCNDIGCNIKAVVCDQGSNNRKMFKLLNITSEKPYFEHNSKRIFALYDIPHLFKSIRNTLIKYDLLCEDGKVSWNVVKELHNIEKQKKCVRRLHRDMFFQIHGKK